MKRLLITGATGYIGAATLAPLKERGFEIHDPRQHGLDLLTDDPAPLLAELRPTHLLHLAWIAEPGKFWAAPQNLDWLAASLRLTRAFAASGGERMVTAGSCAEYDWSYPLLDEATTPLRPSTLYGTAKAALFSTLAAASLGPTYAHARIFFPYGGTEKPSRLLPDVISAVRAGRRVATTDGAQTRDFIHVDDCAAALAALLDSPVTGPVNIASGTAHPLRQIITLAATLAGDASLIDWGARPRQPTEPAAMAAATHRLTHDVGFTPRISLAAGLAAMVAGVLP